ncbi:MAG TPA: acetyl/propionyl-CoA carboxylase subunit alpha, partial [Burkholderiaceae bacterium]|nr:acetyl/propionyl-CoA carboxylase subunit alpha [Burkholderiaceae bacterium]
MNTRLQVEHPVTECITGLDLVEQMIRVAAGEKLSFGQADIKREGWAIECRINAEDPFRNFLPSTGRLVKYAPPAADLEQGTETLQGPAYNGGKFGGVRVDTGVYEGGEIPMFYDSMIAKLIVHGRDRNEAIAKMREALNAFVIRGISSNIPFQAALLAHPKFVTGQFNTGFIAEHYSKGFKAEDVPHDDPAFLVALAAFVRRKARERAAGISGQLPGHEVAHKNEMVVVQLGAEGQHVYHDVTLGDFDPAAGTVDVGVGGKTFAIQSHTKLGDVLMTGLVNGRPFSAQVEQGSAKRPLAIKVAHNGTAIEALVLLPRAAELFKLMPYKAPPDLSKFLLSPMPGLLVDVAVTAGQKVLAGEKLAVIEAMKMENILVATQDCVVKEVRAAKGESLAVDQAIIAFE